MKMSARFAFACLLLAATGAMAATPDCAVAPSDTGLPGVVAGLEAPAPPSADLAPVEGPEVTATACSATAFCNNGTTVSCSTGGSGTCQGVNSSCPSQRGYVTCGGQTTYCPSCPTISYCVQGDPCGFRGLCGSVGGEPGVCYQGSCRCYCSGGTSCSTNSDCGPSNSGGVCSGGTCYCY